MIGLFCSTSMIMGIKCFRCIHMKLQIKRKHSFAQLLHGVCVFFFWGPGRPLRTKDFIFAVRITQD